MDESTLDDSKIINNTAQNRYQLTVNGETAYMSYMHAGQNIVISHTEVPVDLEGQGIGGKLAKHVLESLQAEGKQAIIT